MMGNCSGKLLGYHNHYSNKEQLIRVISFGLLLQPHLTKVLFKHLATHVVSFNGCQNSEDEATPLEIR